MMSSSSVKRKTEEDLMDSVKKVKQSDSTETKDPNKDKLVYRPDNKNDKKI